MRRVIPVMALILTLGACGSGARSGEEPSSTSSVETPDATSTSTPAGSTSSSPPQSTTTSTPGPGVDLALSGWVTEDRRGTVVCPGESTQACPGIPVRGGDLPAEGPVRVVGWYDGVALSAETVESWTPYGRGALVNPCTGESGPGSGSQSEEVESGISDALAGHEDRLAGLWYADGQLVVGLTGSDDELADRIRAVDENVCVEAGYSRSQQELETLVTDITRRLIDEDVWTLESWDTVVDHPIRIRVEAIDTSTKDAVAALYGDDLDLNAYIEVLDASLADLPEQQLPVPADLLIPTAGTRGGAAMMALAMGFVLEVDTEAGCLYVDGGDGYRQVVVWPFGYSAVSGDPTIVYGPAGDEMARTGVPFDLGGGSVDIGWVDPSERCGADSAWQAGGLTLYALETLWSQDSDSEDD